jgi:hypothetical protein
MRVTICGAALMVIALGGCGARTPPPSPVPPVPPVLQPIIAGAHTPLEKAAALLPWAAATVVVGTPEVPARHDLATLLPIFEARTGGGSCGLFATFYQDVLAKVGVPAITVDLGIPGTPTTHVTTLVWDHDTFYVFDPTYNGRFLDASGHDVPLPAVLSNPSLVIHENAVRRGVVYPAGDIADPECANLRPSSSRMSTCEMVVSADTAVTVAKINHLEGDFVGAMLRTRLLSVGPSTKEQRTALARILQDARIPNDSAP